MADDPLLSLLGGPQEQVPQAQAPPVIPAPAQGAPTDRPQTWTQWLAAPENRAFLISAGAQMMQPAWGGMGANLGQAMAQGAEASAGTQRLELDREAARLERENRQRVAEIAAESRTDVAGIRSQAMLERARMIGARTIQEVTAYDRMVTSIYGRLLATNPLAGSGRRPDAELRAQAMDMADEIVRRRGGFQSIPDTPGTAPPQGPTGPTGPAPPSRGPTGPASSAPSTPSTPPSPSLLSAVPGLLDLARQFAYRSYGELSGLAPGTPSAPSAPGAPPPSTSSPYGESPVTPPGPESGLTPVAPTGTNLSQFLANPRYLDILRDRTQRQRIFALHPTWREILEDRMRENGITP